VSAPKAASDWFRRTTWTPADEEDFFARLGRARFKAQYLRIQAVTLLGTGVREHAEAAVRLCDILRSEHPERTEMSHACVTRGRALLTLGRVPEALGAFRDALQARRAFPGAVDDGWLEFAWAVARLGIREAYDEALSVLNEFSGPRSLAFPADAYRYFGALALISDGCGDPAEAGRWAKRALEAASVTKGPFSRHPTVGVLDPAVVDRESHRKLWELAASR
jgi:hypothetical protein